MIKITEDNLKDLDLNGIVIGVPKEKFPGYEFCFITECSYWTKGKHGYPEAGHHPDNSSFYHITYNLEDYLNHGLFMNSTTRLTIEDAFHFEYANYYKFEDMKEFCRWYLQQGNVTSTDELINSMWKMSDEIQQLRHENEKLKEATEGLLKVQYALADSCKKYRSALEEIKVISDNYNLTVNKRRKQIADKINEVIGEDTES